MDLSKFKEVLDNYGVRHRESQKALNIGFCPSCGSEKFKIAFALSTEEKGLFGKCFRVACQTGYNAFKYLKLIGASAEEIDYVCGTNPAQAFAELDPSYELFLFEIGKGIQQEPEPDIHADTIKKEISEFIELSSMPDHPAYKYAVSRGVDPTRHSKNVKIDLDSNSVAFVCFDESGKEVGYQLRFVNSQGNLKTKTAIGFQAHSHLLVFNSGESKDIAVCEGPFTAISASNFGFTGVCTFGAGILVKQMQKIADLARSRGVSVGIAFDMDEAGEKGSDRLMRYLMWENIPVYKIIPEIGSDLNDSEKAGKRFIIESFQDLNMSIPKVELLGL